MSMITSFFEFVGGNIISLAGGISVIIGVVVTYFAKKYLVPLLRVEKAHRYAKWIAAIADELTDDLKAKYPDKKLLDELDKVVDKIIEICGIDREVAERAVRAAAMRKG